MRKLVENAHEEVARLLAEHREQLESLTQALLKAETLDAKDAYAAAGVPAHVEEPSVVFPPDGSLTQINVAAVREDDSQLALIVQSTFDGGVNPQKKTAWFLSVDGGATWTKTSVPDAGWSPYTSSSPFSSYYDMGGPYVRSTASGATRAGLEAFGMAAPDWS